MSSLGSSGLAYRPEIDGLRALAVVSVIFYHMSFFLKGGYYGVDIFFVISGYLISLIVLRELKEDGTFSLSKFYERRARRILPVISLIVFLSIFFAWFTMGGAQLEAYGLSLLAISTFLSNFVFWQNSGYFAPSNDFLPMLHTWSLAIEEQFYVIFPFFLIICWKYTRKYLLSILTFAFIGSLVFADWFSRDYIAPEAAFYLLPGRGWELLSGAVVAKIEMEVGRPHNKIFDAVMPTIGIFLIAYTFIFYNKDIQHPSFFTLIPILGTIILIWFCKPGELITDILSSKILVGIGLISYSLYLWHVPILVFSRFANLGKLPTHLNYWFIPLIFTLSLISWKFIEVPFRNSEIISKRKFILSMFTIWLLIITTGLCFRLFDGLPKRDGFPES
ncbi:MAG: acyltransferase, partial [Magnetococcales bacterium]|nr:acyltransferase [Magnetococcales bacterium]